MRGAAAAERDKHVLRDVPGLAQHHSTKQGGVERPPPAAQIDERPPSYCVEHAAEAPAIPDHFHARR